MTAWYQLKDGSDYYTLLRKLPQTVAGGMGYIPWQKADLTFTPHPDARAFTVFFSTTGRKDCEPCGGPNHRTLNIANVVLENNAPLPALGNSELLAQIAALEHFKEFALGSEGNQYRNGASVGGASHSNRAAIAGTS